MLALRWWRILRPLTGKGGRQPTMCEVLLLQTHCTLQREQVNQAEASDSSHQYRYKYSCSVCKCSMLGVQMESSQWLFCKASQRAMARLLICTAQLLCGAAASASVNMVHL